MNLQNLKLKASTLCAGGTLLVFGGFLTVNLAGCGGGGGGGLTQIPTPRPIGATFRIVQQDGLPSRGGSLSLTGGGRTFAGTADNNGVVVLGSVPPGTYNATYNAVTSSGMAQPETTRRLVVTSSGAQSFMLVQGDTGGNGRFKVTGKILTNLNNNDFTRCNSRSAPIQANILVTVRDLNDTTGAPIIAQIVRPVQDSNVPDALKGLYTVSLPTNPRSFRVEVSPADNNGTRYAGISATTTFTQGTTTIDNVDICANDNGKIPVPFSPTATPTNTPVGGSFPVITSTPTFTPTPDPNGTATPTATSTSTPTPPPTPTQPGTGTGTPVPNTTVAPLPTTPVGNNARTAGKRR